MSVSRDNEESHERLVDPSLPQEPNTHHTLPSATSTLVSSEHTMLPMISHHQVYPGFLSSEGHVINMDMPMQQLQPLSLPYRGDHLSTAFTPHAFPPLHSGSTFPFPGAFAGPPFPALAYGYDSSLTPAFAELMPFHPQHQPQPQQHNHQSTPAPKRPRAKRRGPKKPLSAFMFFCAEHRAAMTKQHPECKFAEIGRYLGKAWRHLPPERKEPYAQMNVEDRQRYSMDIQDLSDVSDGSSSDLPERKERKKRVRREGPKRALSAYMYFAKETRPQLRHQFPDATFADVARMLGERWAAMGAEEKEPFERQCATDKNRFRLEKEAMHMRQQQQVLVPQPPTGLSLGPLGSHTPHPHAHLAALGTPHAHAHTHAHVHGPHGLHGLRDVGALNMDMDVGMGMGAGMGLSGVAVDGTQYVFGFEPAVPPAPFSLPLPDHPHPQLPEHAHAQLCPPHAHTHAHAHLHRLDTTLPSGSGGPSLHSHSHAFLHHPPPHRAPPLHIHTHTHTHTHAHTHPASPGPATEAAAVPLTQPRALLSPAPHEAREAHKAHTDSGLQEALSVGPHHPASPPAQPASLTRGLSDTPTATAASLCVGLDGSAATHSHIQSRMPAAGVAAARPSSAHCLDTERTHVAHNAHNAADTQRDPVTAAATAAPSHSHSRHAMDACASALAPLPAPCLPRPRPADAPPDAPHLQPAQMQAPAQPTLRTAANVSSDSPPHTPAHRADGTTGERDAADNSDVDNSDADDSPPLATAPSLAALVSALTASTATTAGRRAQLGPARQHAASSTSRGTSRAAASTAAVAPVRPCLAAGDTGATAPAQAESLLAGPYAPPAGSAAAGTGGAECVAAARGSASPCAAPQPIPRMATNRPFSPAQTATPSASAVSATSARVTLATLVPTGCAQQQASMLVAPECTTEPADSGAAAGLVCRPNATLSPSTGASLAVSPLPTCPPTPDVPPRAPAASAAATACVAAALPALSVPPPPQPLNTSGGLPVPAPTGEFPPPSAHDHMQLRWLTFPEHGGAHPAPPPHTHADLHSLARPPSPGACSRGGVVSEQASNAGGPPSAPPPPSLPLPLQLAMPGFAAPMGAPLPSMDLASAHVHVSAHAHTQAHAYGHAYGHAFPVFAPFPASFPAPLAPLAALPTLAPHAHLATPMTDGFFFATAQPPHLAPVRSAASTIAPAHNLPGDAPSVTPASAAVAPSSDASPAPAVAGSGNAAPLGA